MLTQHLTMTTTHKFPSLVGEQALVGLGLAGRLVALNVGVRLLGVFPHGVGDGPHSLHALFDLDVLGRLDPVNFLGWVIYELESVSRVVSTSRLAPDWLHKSEQPI